MVVEVTVQSLKSQNPRSFPLSLTDVGFSGQVCAAAWAEAVGYWSHLLALAPRPFAERCRNLHSLFFILV